MQENLLLGSKVEHFYIEDNKIISFSENMKDYLSDNTYIGPFKICFSGCEQITEIEKGAFQIYDLREGVNSIDLSCMKALEKIDECAFKLIGSGNEHFDYINLSCPQLKIIGQEAFENVGCDSKYVKLIFNCPNLKIIDKEAFLNVASDPFGLHTCNQVDNQQVKNITLDLSNCSKLEIIGASAFCGYSFRARSPQAEIKLPPNIKHIKEQAFRHVFGSSEEIFIDLSNKLQLQYIDQYCFHYNSPPNIKVIISYCPELIYIKPQLTYKLSNLIFDIDINTCPKLKEFFGYNFAQYKYHKQFNREQLFKQQQSKYITYLQLSTKEGLCEFIQQLNEQQIIQQYQLLDVKHKHQQVLFELNNIQSISDKLQKKIDLQDQIIKEQHNWYIFLKKQVELFNQQYSKEDGQ